MKYLALLLLVSPCYGGFVVKKDPLEFRGIKYREECESTALYGHPELLIEILEVWQEKMWPNFWKDYDAFERHKNTVKTINETGELHIYTEFPDIRDALYHSLDKLGAFP